MNKCLNCSKKVKNKFCSVRCQNIYQGSERANKKYGKYKLFDISCYKCNKSFQIQEREKLFPTKEYYYCSRSCANSRIHSEFTKSKISTSLIESPFIKKRIINKKSTTTKQCFFCKKETINNKFCSKSCAKKHYMSQGDIASIMGRKSVAKQKKIKRSKNEIYFGELCLNKFSKVLFNEPLFNGWDADIIVPDLKIAILWNGKWHYEKITKTHSVEQVQNRDKIKLKEIENSGYRTYVVKDMGKYNKEFVEKEFANFLVFL